MLTLMRRSGESLYLQVEGLAEPIRIRLDSISGWNQARLSIDADKALVNAYRMKEWSGTDRPDRD